MYDISGDDILGQLDISGDDETLIDGLDFSTVANYALNPVKHLQLLASAAQKLNPMQLFQHPQQAAVQQALINKQVQQGTLVRQMKPRAQRNLFIGFQSLAIAANALATITQQPQLPFKGYRLSVPQQFAPFFTIVDIRVGKDSQLVSPGAVPATSFNEVSVGDNISMDTADVGQLITIQVQNIDGAAAHDFRATLFGKTVLMGR
jgi:hypothetical protein